MPKNVRPQNVSKLEKSTTNHSSELSDEVPNRKRRKRKERERTPEFYQPITQRLPRDFDVFDGLTGQFCEQNQSSGRFLEKISIELESDVSSSVREAEEYYGQSSSSNKKQAIVGFANRSGKGSSRKDDLSQNVRPNENWEFVQPEIDEIVKDEPPEHGPKSHNRATQLGCEKAREVSKSHLSWDVASPPPPLSPQIADDVFCLQLEDDITCRLILPPSSTDLLIENELLMAALEVYEVFRRFHQLLRLTPFTFEDFCAVLQLSEENTQLLAEIHIALMRVIIKSEESFGFAFTPADCKATFDLIVHHIDEATWPVIVSDYVMSLEAPICYSVYGMSETVDHSARSDSAIETARKVVTMPQFPFVNAAYRLVVLKVLVDIFADLDIMRNDINSDGQITYDTKCRRCGDPGNLLCCDNCDAVYHLQCIRPPLESIPDNQWLCPLCDVNQLPGVNEATLSEEVDDCTSAASPRNECLGYDRHLRRYWFISRRLVVERGDFVRYYSQREQVNYILESLDALCLEKALHTRLVQLQSVMAKQMALTMELTQTMEDQLTSNGKSSLDLKMIFTEDLLAFEDFVKYQEELRSKEEEGTVAMEEFHALNDSDELFYGGQFDSEALSCFPIKYSCDKYEKGPSLLQQRKSSHLYCLGMDNSVGQYVNFFNKHALSMNSLQLKEIQEKKRQLGYKFCMEPEWKWQCSMVGSVNQMVSGLRQAIEQIEEQVPPLFMHKEWFEKYPNGTHSIIKSEAPTMDDLVKALTALQQHFKPCLFLPVWKEACTLGFWVKCLQPKKDAESTSSANNNNASQASKETLSDLVNMSCSSAMQTETAKVMSECITDEYYQKIYEADLEKPVFVSVPLKHNLYKTRGELYRQIGHGWVWVKKKKRSKGHLNSKKIGSHLVETTGIKSRKTTFQLNSDNKSRNNITIGSKSQESLSCNDRSTVRKTNSVEFSSKPVIDVQSLFQKSENENLLLKRNTQLRHLLDVRLRQAAKESKFDYSEVEKFEKQIEDLHQKVFLIDDQISSINSKIRKFEELMDNVKVADETELAPLCYSCSKNGEKNIGFHETLCYSPLCIEYRKTAAQEGEFKNHSDAEQKIDDRQLKDIEADILNELNLVKNLRDQKSKLELELTKAQASLDGLTATSFVHKLSSKDIDGSMTKNKTTFENLNNRTSESIFSLPRFQLKTLAQSGLASVSEVSPSLFPHKLSTNSNFWPYFCDRPNTKQVWEQMLESAKPVEPSGSLHEAETSGDNDRNKEINLLCTDEESIATELGTTGSDNLVTNDFMLPCTLSSIAVMVRLLHASMRWEDLKQLEESNVPKDLSVNFLDKGFAYRIQLEPGTAIIKDPQNVRDVAPLNLETEFLLRIVNLSDDRGGSAIVENSMKDGAISPTKRPGKVRRSGRTPKFKQSLLNSCNNGRTVDMQWISETDLELWEVKHLLQSRSLIIRKYEQEQLRKAQLERQKAIRKARQLELEARAKALSNVKLSDKMEKEFGVWSDSDDEPTNERNCKKSDSMQSNLVTGFAASGTAHGEIGKTVKCLSQQQQQLNGARRVVVVRCADGTSKQLVLNNPIVPLSSPGNQVFTSGQSIQPDGTSRPIKIIPIQASSILSQNPQITTVTTPQNSASPKTFRVISSHQLGLEPNNATSNSQQQWSAERAGFGVDSTPQRNSASTIPGTKQDIARNIVTKYLQQNGCDRDQQAAKNTISKRNLKIKKLPKQRLRLSPKKTYRDLNSKTQMCMNLRSETERLKYEELTRKLTFRCQQNAKRAYKTQIERKRSLMKEQIDLELMFKRIKVPLSRKVYELPYTAVIQNQLLPENDNDPNISFSSSSESENDNLSNIVDDDELITPGVKEEILTSDEEKMWKSNLKFSVSETGVLRNQQADNNSQHLSTVAKKGQENLSKPLLSENKKSSVVKKEIKAEKRKSNEENYERAKRFQNQDENLETKKQNKIHQSRKEVFDHISSISVKQDPDNSEIVMVDSSAKSKQKNVKKENELKVSVKSEPNENSILQKGSQLRFGDTETLHCICRTIYDYKKFYLKCELCLNWFHGKCVGINQKQSKRLNEFICPNCSENSNKDELYCICKTPYDENQFYIGCDACGNWFHGSCVGISSDEASKIENYFCPNCKSEEKKEDDSANLNFVLESEHFELLGELMRVLMEHKHSWPFNEKSTDKEYPNYSKFVADPICFRDISDKLSSHAYSTFSDFNADINRVFSNARKYHWKDSSEFQCCDIVEKELVTFLTSFRQSIQADESGEDEEGTEDENDDEGDDSSDS